MKEHDKISYEAPVTSVLELSHEGIICNSQVKGRNLINGWGDGGTTEDNLYM